MLFFSLFSHDPELVTVNAGDALFHEGEEGDSMYVLISGTADVWVHGRIVERAAMGTILGEMSVIEPGIRSATVMATTDCTCAKIDEQRFRFLVSETPHFAIEVMRVMADRLRHTDAMLA